jgi:hypothetical protein
VDVFGFSVTVKHTALYRERDTGKTFSSTGRTLREGIFLKEIQSNLKSPLLGEVQEHEK